MKLVAIIATIIYMAGFCAALQCYDCRYPSNTNCGDDFVEDESMIHGCEPDETFCRKYEYWYKGDLQEAMRNCGPECTESDQSPGDSRHVYTCCQTDLCNGKDGLQGSTGLFLLLLVATVLV